jgi:chromosome partition protein MukE
MSTPTGYAQLGDVVLDPSFPELDLALRRGRHIDREDLTWYALLTDAQDHLEAFYRRYGCELIHKTDGYFYLLPTGEKLSRRQLGAADMLVGQALALLYLDPTTIERGGRVTTEDVLTQLVVVLGSDALLRLFNPKRRRQDERVAQKNVRARVAEAIRHLAALGFVDLTEEEQLRLRPALLRFAEPVRGTSAPADALAKLVAQGEVSLIELDAEPEVEPDAEPEAEPEAEVGAGEGVADPASDSTEASEPGSAQISEVDDEDDDW